MRTGNANFRAGITPWSAAVVRQATNLNPGDRAGITTYSPLAHFGAKAKGAACTTGVVGFGGLGHVAVKLAKAMVGRARIPPPPASHSVDAASLPSVRSMAKKNPAAAPPSFHAAPGELLSVSSS
jgi:hypothetical protein